MLHNGSKARTPWLCFLILLFLFAPVVPTGIAAPQAPYTFAVLGPFSGPNAAFGVGMKNGLELAVSEINRSGGVNGRTFQLKVFDTQCQPTQAANAAARIASDPSIFGAIGDICSSATLAALPILARARLTIVSGNATSPKITQVVKDNKYNNFARTQASDTQQGPAMVYLAVNVLNKKRIGVLYSSDDYGQGLYGTIEPTVRRITGASIVGAETFVPGTTKDFTPQWTNLAGKNPDVILLCGYFNDIGTAVGQMSRGGLRQVVLVGASGIAEIEYVKLAGAAAEGTYMLNNYDSSNPSPANRKLVTAYRAKFGQVPGVEVPFNYVIPYLFKTAIERGATRPTLGEHVRKISLTSTAIGAIRFSQYGDNVAVPQVVQVVRNGKFAFDAGLTQKVLRLLR